MRSRSALVAVLLVLALTGGIGALPGASLPTGAPTQPAGRASAGAPSPSGAGAAVAGVGWILGVVEPTSAMENASNNAFFVLAINTSDSLTFATPSLNDPSPGVFNMSVTGGLTYNVTVGAVGYVTQVLLDVAVPVGGPSNLLNFDLQPSAHSAPPNTPCALLAARYASLYDGPELPEDVPAALQGPCDLGHDTAGLGLLSNLTFSGERLQAAVQLPPADTSPERLVAGFELGLWVSGVPCSVDGASYLSVDLVPPFGGQNGSGSPNWTVYAPVWDLVPVGGCDPLCQNLTALFTLEGADRRFCEENAAPQPTANGSRFSGFLPGDTVSITLVGAVGGATGLQLYLNSSEEPSLRLALSYDAGAARTGRPLEPLSNRSVQGSGGWGDGPAVSLQYALCPGYVPGSTGRPTACNSYDGGAEEAASLPAVVGIESWEMLGGSYGWGYPAVAPFSTSGGCSGRSGASPCADFADEGGNGLYPFWSLVPAASNSSWEFGTGAPGNATDLGGLAQYNSSGATGRIVSATGIELRSVNVTSSRLTVTAEVANPSKIGNVSLTGYYCFAGSTPSELSTSMGADPGAGAQYGNFTGALTLSSSYHGTIYFEVMAASEQEDGWPNTVWANVTDGFGSSACVFPAPSAPVFGNASVTPVGGGFRLNFTESDPFATNFTLTLTPFRGGPSAVRPLNGSGPITVPFGGGGAAWNLSVAAYDVTDQLSGPSAEATNETPLAPLELRLATENLSWAYLPTTPLWFNATVDGGLAPYTVSFVFGDGTHNTTTLPGSFTNVTHAFGGAEGVALVTAYVVDADGVEASAGPFGVILDSGPGGLNQSLSAGVSDVYVNWSAPVGPPTPVTGYTVFYAFNASAAPLVTEAWDGNDTALGVYLWNVSSPGLFLTLLAPGTTVYAVVVARDAIGAGLLPEGWFATPWARTANLTATPIAVTPPGGPAPLNASLSVTLTGGTNDSFAEAIYSWYYASGLSGAANATLTGNLTTWWANATVLLPDAGTVVLLLHITDVFGDPVIPYASLIVSPAGLVNVSASVTSGTAFVGQPVSFAASASGGTGAFAYAWSFGDGGRATGATPTHTYAASGNYTVEVDVTDTGDNYSVDTTTALTVYAPPSASVAVSAVAPFGFTYNFTAEVTGGFGNLTYAWSFGDGLTAHGRSVIHTYAGAGIYDVQLSVTDQAHFTSTASVVVDAPGPTGTGGGSNGAGAWPYLAAGLGVLAAVGLGAAAYLAFRRRPGAPEEPEYEGPAPFQVGPENPPAMPEPERPGLDAPAPPALDEPVEPVRAPLPPDPPDPS